MLKYLRIGIGVALLCSMLPVSGGPAPRNVAPKVTLTSPLAGASYVPPATISMSVTATDADGAIAKVDYYRGGTTLIGTSTAAPFGITWSNVAAGSYVLTAKATDNQGAVATSAAVSVAVAAQKIVISNPLPGSAVYGESVNVTGTFVGDANTTVLVDNGNSSRLATIAGSSFSAVVPIFLGPNALNVQVTRADKTFDRLSMAVSGNEAPRIIRTMPTTATFDAPATVTFAVSALSATGSIKNVEFFKSGQLAAAVTVPPYVTTLTGLAAGSYQLSAVATDNYGYTSNVIWPIQVNGANTYPAVAITGPAPASIFTAPATVVLNAGASDSDGSIAQVEFMQNGAYVGATNVVPYRYTLSGLPPGDYVVAARATDNRGAVTISPSVSFRVVSAIAPLVAITSPAQNASFTKGTTITMTSSASAEAGTTIANVEYFSGTTLLGRALTPPYSVTWLPPAAGAYVLTAKATDTRGMVSNADRRDISVQQSSVPPTVAFVSPVENAVYTRGESPLLSVNATAEAGASISNVEYYVGATLVGRVTAAPYTVTWQYPVSGAYELSAKATDNRGLSAVSAKRNVTIGDAPLTAQITAPANNTKVSAPGVVLVTVDASSGNSTIRKVELFDNGQFLTSVEPANLINSYQFNYNWSLSTIGLHNLTAVVTDSLTTTITTPVVAVQVVAPSVVITANPAKAIAPALITLNATANAEGAAISKVDFYQGTTLIGTASNAPYTYVWSGVAAGNYSVSARAVDTLGGVASSGALTVTVTAPSLDATITAPASGAFINGDSVVVSGNLLTTLNAGVTVNGVVAAIADDNRFYAQIPLSAGSNAIQVIVTPQMGDPITRDITVTASGVSAPLTVNVRNGNGYAPLTAEFALSNSSDGSLTVRVGEGASFVLRPGESSVSTVTLPNAWAAPVNVVATDSQAISHTQEFVLVAVSREAAAEKMKVMWNGLNTAVIGGDLPKALSYLNGEAKLKYGPVFNLLQPEFAQMVATWSPPMLASLTPSIGEFYVVTNKDGIHRVFLVYFLKGGDGVWRIDAM